MIASLRTKPLKYLEIRKRLDRFAAKMRPGDKLPSERELARAFDCNALTVRKAMLMLVGEGRIVRRTGSGTFVADAPAPAESAGVRKSPVRKTSVHRMGLLIPAESDAYALRVIQALARAAEAGPLELRSDWVQDFGEQALRQAKVLAREGSSALILPWFPAKRLHEVSEFVRRCPLPVVLPALIPGLEKNCFETPAIFGRGTLRATEAACRYFRILGHERIAFLGPDASQNEILQRALSAYTSFVCREGLEPLCGLMDETVESMDALATKWLRFQGTLAVVSYDDAHAIRFLTAMHKRGRSAPADFRILGFNDLEEARRSDPPLSSLAPVYAAIAAALLRSAAALARGGLAQSSREPSHALRVRQSCGGASRLTDELLAAMKKLGVTVETEESSLPGRNS
jgi:DNA-binding LacI/PurR family transcriptional regulator